MFYFKVPGRWILFPFDGVVSLCYHSFHNLTSCLLFYWAREWHRPFHITRSKMTNKPFFSQKLFLQDFHMKYMIYLKDNTLSETEHIYLLPLSCSVELNATWVSKSIYYPSLIIFSKKKNVCWFIVARGFSGMHNNRLLFYFLINQPQP